MRAAELDQRAMMVKKAAVAEVLADCAPAGRARAQYSCSYVWRRQVDWHTTWAMMI